MDICGFLWKIGGIYLDLRDLLYELCEWLGSDKPDGEFVKEVFENVYVNPRKKTDNFVSKKDEATFRGYLTSDSMQSFCKKLRPGLNLESIANYLDSFSDYAKEDFIGEHEDLNISVDNFGEEVGLLLIKLIREEATNGTPPKPRRKPKANNKSTETTTTTPSISDLFSGKILEDISEHKDYYVETDDYFRALDLLKENRILLLIGAPGMGKTFLTEMIAKYYSEEKGYHLVFSDQIEKTEGVIAQIERDPNLKEFVILDDCFGQIYYKLTESNQKNDIVRLIHKISNCPNKLLVMNSRVEIYNFAKGGADKLRDALCRLNAKGCILNIEKLSTKEKAKILERHLSLNPNIDSNFCEELLKNDNYRKIIFHKNYTPRIMWYIADMLFLDGVTPKTFVQKAIDKLDKPDEIWKDEYTNRLEERDRLVLTTLYSITDGQCELSKCELAYNRRIELDSSIETGRDPWNQALSVLNGGMVKCSIIQGIEYISVLNPSVNDYLKNYPMHPGSSEIVKQQGVITYYCQYDRLYQDTKKRQEEKEKIIKDKSVLALQELYPVNTTKDIVYEIIRTNTCYEEYQEYIDSFMKNGPRNAEISYIYEPSIGYSNRPEEILALLFTTPKIYDFYMGKYTIIDVLDFLYYSDSFTTAWKCLVDIDEKIHDTFNWDDDEVYDAFSNTFDNLIDDYAFSFDSQSIIESEIGELREEKEYFTDHNIYWINERLDSVCRDAIYADIIETSDETLQHLIYDLIDNHGFDFSSEVDQYIKDTTRDDRYFKQPISERDHIHSLIENQNTREIFEDLYKEKKAEECKNEGGGDSQNLSDI